MTDPARWAALYAVATGAAVEQQVATPTRAERLAALAASWGVTLGVEEAEGLLASVFDLVGLADPRGAVLDVAAADQAAFRVLQGLAMDRSASVAERGAALQAKAASWSSPVSLTEEHACWFFADPTEPARVTGGVEPPGTSKIC